MLVFTAVWRLQIFSEYSSSKIKLNLYWARVGSSYSNTRNSPVHYLNLKFTSHDTNK